MLKPVLAEKSRPPKEQGVSTTNSLGYGQRGWKTVRDRTRLRGIGMGRTRQDRPVAYYCRLVLRERLEQEHSGRDSTMDLPSLPTPTRVLRFLAVAQEDYCSRSAIRRTDVHFRPGQVYNSTLGGGSRLDTLGLPARSRISGGLGLQGVRGVDRQRQWARASSVRSSRRTPGPQARPARCTGSVWYHEAHARYPQQTLLHARAVTG